MEQATDPPPQLSLFERAVIYVVLILSCNFVINFYGNLSNKILLQFAYKLIDMKTEYQNVLSNLDEGIIQQKDGAL